MALYLGNNKVSAISKIIIENNNGGGNNTPSTDVTLTQTEWNNLQNAVEYRTSKDVVTNPDIDDLVDQLNEDYGIFIDSNININGNINDIWTRPNDWPNLDSLNLSFSGENDFIYMTYRVGHADDYFGCNIKTVSGTATIDFGYISNGSYIIDSTRTAGSTSGENFYYYFNNETEGYTVIRVTGKLSWFLLIGATSANNTPDNRTLINLQQPLLERIAYVPNITKFYDSDEYWGTYSLAREKIDNGTGTACTTIRAIYCNCQNLQNLDISNFNTPNVTNMQDAFKMCCSLKVIDVAHWNVDKVTSLQSTFYQCYSLKNIYGLKNFKNSNNYSNIVTIFYLCENLENINDISNWNISSKVTRLDGVFSNCIKVTTLDLSNWDLSCVTRVDNMFNNCSSLKNIKFPTGQTANLLYISSLFSNCYNLQNVDVSWLKMDSGTCLQMNSLFNNCRSLTEINIPNDWDLSALDNSNLSHFSIFSGCTSLKKITGITNWDFRSSTTQSAYNMFAECWSLKELDISGWKLNSTSYVSFFKNCYSLESVDISGFDFSNCTTLNSMFQNCYNLKEIVTPNTWNTSKITTTADMFNNCYSLKNIDINFSSWDVSKITNISNMFANCYSLKSITINNWNLEACTAITALFNNNFNLEEITWTGWLLPKLTNTSPGRLLENCFNLKKMTGFPPIKLAFSMRGTNNFPADQFVVLFNNLQNTGGTARTLNINNININKLSTTEQAIATNKGWTLAN